MYSYLIIIIIRGLLKKIIRFNEDTDKCFPVFSFTVSISFHGNRFFF